MDNNEATFLDLEEVNKLLPENLKIDTKKKLERSVYRTCEGDPLPVLNSRLYPDNSYWYSSITKYYKEIGAEYICFTAGFNGIFVIPIDIILHYNRFSGWKRRSYRGLHYHVRIKHRKDGTITLWNFNEPSENKEITQYFYKKN